MSGRATRNMDRLAVRLDGTTLVVDVNRMLQSDKDPAGWARRRSPSNTRVAVVRATISDAMFGLARNDTGCRNQSGADQDTTKRMNVIIIAPSRTPAEASVLAL